MQNLDRAAESKPIVWCAMDSVPMDGREILVRPKSPSAIRYWVMGTGRWRNGEPWLSSGKARHHPNSFGAWANVPA